MKKKILFVTNHFRYSNGVATVLRSLIANLDQNIYDISLLALYEFDNEFAKPILNKIKVIKGYNFYFIGFDKLINLLPPQYIYKRFIKEKYDLEIAFQFGIPTKCIAISKNKNKICWMHTFDEKMILEKYYKMFPKIVNVSKIGRYKLIKKGFNEKKCDYCYNIIDEDIINRASQEKIEIDKKHKYSIVTVSRLAPDKACMRLLECINKITETNKNVEFWIIGSGSEEKKMKKYISDNNLEDVVKMFGKQENPYKFIRKADLYLCSSYREGFSTACQEAAILGIPVITVDVDGAQELIESAECGKVIPNNKDSICNEINKIISDDELIKNWKNKSIKTRNKFFKKERIKKINKVLINNS